MRIKENWALFVEGTEIKWSFGNPSAEFREIVSNFLMGVGNLGKELFGEGIASIAFDRRQHSVIKASEIFIVSLQDQFFLIISDPAVTLMLLTSQGGIPDDIKEIMTAVLVGQASILYANSITDVDDESRIRIERHFQEIILDINEKYAQNGFLKTIVGEYGSNFSILSFEECLLLHYYLRKQAERSGYAAPAGWAMIANLEGWEVPLAFNLTREGIWAGFFAAIVGFIHSLFESKPRHITFGTTEIQKLRFIYGTKYFMAIDTSFVSDLLLRKQFQKELFGTSYAILKDMSTGIKNLIIEEILQYNEDKLNQLSVESLLDTYIGEDESTDLTQNERMLRVWGKLMLNFQEDKKD
ncbi:MAG: hypothetical protein ACXAC8_04115 [Candidatus Hodarchaeales archaeon]|jgi:hypothetical protein